ncbi:MAG: hypothetical protein E4G90_11725 [Gemmatimonadales bacterium]|nr:MAG: hypothetical protein E4G90_11725 [Gemmatimonadales bacterium]
MFSYRRADNGGWATNYLMNFDKVGDGGLYSTVEDLARWDAAFYADLLDVEGFAAKMYQRGVLTGGDTIAYARGLAISPRRGLTRVLHGGSLMGFRTGIARYPDQRTTVITLCNVSSARSGALSAAVEDIVLGGSFLEPVTPTSAPGGAQSVTVKPAQVPEDVIRQMAGTYRSEELRATWVLEPAADKLVLKVPGDDGVDFLPKAETVYSGSGVTLTFVREGDQVVAFVLQAGRVKNLRFDRVP